MCLWGPCTQIYSHRPNEDDPYNTHLTNRTKTDKAQHKLIPWGNSSSNANPKQRKKVFYLRGRKHLN